jgi:hypothetical protein
LTGNPASGYTPHSKLYLYRIEGSFCRTGIDEAQPAPMIAMPPRPAMLRLKHDL